MFSYSFMHSLHLRVNCMPAFSQRLGCNGSQWMWPFCLDAINNPERKGGVALLLNALLKTLEGR